MKGAWCRTSYQGVKRDTGAVLNIVPLPPLFLPLESAGIVSSGMGEHRYMLRVVASTTTTSAVLLNQRESATLAAVLPSSRRMSADYASL